MMNNQSILNKKFTHQIYHQQRNRYRSNERTNFSPANNHNNNINNIKTIKNPNQNYTMKNKNYQNKNTYYINQKNINQVNISKNIETLKQLKAKQQQNQFYLEGDLNNFINNQNNGYSNSNINNINRQVKNNNLVRQNNNYIQRIPNTNTIKNNKGAPRKSPIPVPKDFSSGKYLNNDNISYISKNSSNSNNNSHYTANSQLINNNYSISNLSQISGYSNNSYNNNQINFGAIIGNENIRAYSNNIHSSKAQKRSNGNINYNNHINRNIMQNKSSNNIFNKQKNISSYTHKVKGNNYINNNMNMNNLLNPAQIKPKYISKSPNPQKGDYLSYTIKRNNNNYINPNNFNMYNNSNISNAINMDNFNNPNTMNKIGYKTSSNFSSYNNNMNLYNNYNTNDRKVLGMTNKGRPLTSHSYTNKKSKNNINGKNKNNTMVMNNQFSLNPNDINLNNYNSNESRQRIIFNNLNKINNNYMYQYNTHNVKRDYSANIPNRMNLNNDYGNNLNNINPMVNLHIINKGQIINNNYNNVNSNNLNNLYVYKYDISQNNILQGKNNINKAQYNQNKTKPKNFIKNNYISRVNDFPNHGMYINYFNNMNNINNERKNNNNYYKKGIKIRSNSSSGTGVTGELNNILNRKNTSKINQNLINAKKIDPTKIGRMNNFMNGNINNNIIQQINNNSNMKKIKSPTKRPIIKQIRKIHHFTHVGFNGEKDKDFNQDIAFLEKNFAGNNSFLYMAVCDGHGVEGHEVSGFIKRILPKELSSALNNKDILNNDKNSKKKIYNIIGETFIKVNEKLISNESINSIFSGTTCVSVIYTPIKLICANIGDSRAVLGRFDNNLKKWVAINLSRDHKPTEEDEARRIYKKGGRIKPFIDEETGEEVGPQRVWVKDDEVPGLAMTRSFGDRVAAIAGTICLPEIKEYIFNEGDKFLILASDGIWEFIQSEECINIIGKFYLNNNIEGCCEFLYTESRKRWIKEEEVVDDITMLLAFFD